MISKSFGFALIAGLSLLPLSCGADKRNTRTGPQEPKAIDAQTDQQHFTITTQNGLALSKSQSVELDLSVYAVAKDGQPAEDLPFCPAPFKSETLIGEVICLDGNSKVEPVALYAYHVRQTCENGHNAFEAIEATETVDMSGCEKARISILNFDPPVQAKLIK